MVEVGDHYRPARGDSDDTGESGDGPVYRVVGATDEIVLLRVTDAAGRRANTGDLRHVASETLTDEFERAENPDADFSPIAEVTNLLSGMYWSVRRFF
ncbi:hypothetical protein M0R89_14375 [Halorussus limi]|uniref:Uncharacterized protein n=1 Tax=Halorussus limi TaxID=2938695 RepID=A0A8U0HS70_9EURY|nr:hypothetical protein [Halorussus limi]UPV73719.1 hypothetical protein M0R89_14375 [Halorussus limi]